MPWNSDAYDRELERITRENDEFTARVMAEMERDRAVMDAWLKENTADIDSLLADLTYDDDKLLADLLGQTAADWQTPTEDTNTVDTSATTDTPT